MTTGNSQSASSRLAQVTRRIELACRRAGRVAHEVALLAVTKGRTEAEINALAAQGQRRFGESYLQEALKKRNQVTVSALEWHFIGPIQSNKTRAIAGHFDWVQSVDRMKILRRLSEQRPRALQPLNICLQINISNEDSKSGASPEDLPALAHAAMSCPGVRLRGLMAIPAQASAPEQQRAAFSHLRVLFEQMKENGYELDTLSMGMSADLEAAIAEGTTMLRIGTALFE